MATCTCCSYTTLCVHAGSSALRIFSARRTSFEVGGKHCNSLLPRVLAGDAFEGTPMTGRTFLLKAIREFLLPWIICYYHEAALHSLRSGSSPTLTSRDSTARRVSSTTGPLLDGLLSRRHLARRCQKSRIPTRRVPSLLRMPWPLGVKHERLHSFQPTLCPMSKNIYTVRPWRQWHRGEA